MFIHGSPISADFPQDPGLKDRFWYWHGASGKKYIHSIYPATCCPPLPGAIYVAVRRAGSVRTAVAVGRVPNFQACAMDASLMPRDEGATEIHVHLLANDPLNAAAILQDLQEAFAADTATTLPTGFHETSRLESGITYAS